MSSSVDQEHELDAAVMVVDVSGFSGMCEQFAQGFVPDGGWRQRMKVSCGKSHANAKKH